MESIWPPLSPQQLAAVRCFELGYIFQTYNLLPVMSALMNVALPTVFAGLSTEEGEERAMECLEIVGLGERAHHIPSKTLWWAAAARGYCTCLCQQAENHSCR